MMGLEIVLAHPDYVILSEGGFWLPRLSLTSELGAELMSVLDYAHEAVSLHPDDLNIGIVN